MNILILTLGSRGDVQPYIALGQALKAKGHTVTICTSSRFEPLITDYGLNYGYMNDEILDLMDSQGVRDIMGDTTNVFGALRAAAKMMGQVGPLQRKMIAETWAAAEEANPDLILFHPKAYSGTHIAEKLGIPSVLVPTLPQFIPTSEITPIGFPKLPIGGWYNKMGYSLTTRLTAMGMGGYTNDWRKTHGLPKQMRGTNFISQQEGKPIPVIHPISKYVMPIPKDWPDYVYMTGFWFLDEADDWTPPDDLKNFLNAGEAPVYIGFGSMIGKDPETMTKNVISALQQAKVRGVIASGWGGIQADDLPDTIFQLKQAPHSWLFPRMAGVVHHGGVGTTAAGLRAGKPTLICPFFGDQPYWGQRIYELGVGPEPIPQKHLTAEALAKGISELVNNKAIHQKAEALGEKIRAEDGIDNAIAIIENVMASHAQSEQSISTSVEAVKQE